MANHVDGYIKRSDIPWVKEAFEERAHNDRWTEVKTIAFKKDVDRIPDADVRPVVRGKWVKAIGSWITPGGDPVWQCSVCGKGKHIYGVEHGSYGADVSDKQWVSCPNCGALMDEPQGESKREPYDLLYEEGGANTT